MPTLTKLGSTLSADARSRDREMERTKKAQFKALDAHLLGRLALALDNMSTGSQVDYSTWDRRQRAILSGMSSDISTSYGRMAGLAGRYQKHAFFDTTNEINSYMKSILPTKAVVKDKKLTKLQFGDDALKLNMITDRVEKEAEAFVASEQNLWESKGTLPDRVFTKDYNDLIYSIKKKAGFKCQKCKKKFTASQLNVHHKDGNRKNNVASNIRVLCYSCHGKLSQKKQMSIRRKEAAGWAYDMVYALTEFLPREVENGGSDFCDGSIYFRSTIWNGGNTSTEAAPVELRVGTGKVSGDWLKVMKDQLDQDLLPMNRIKTLAPDHVKFVQGVMLGGMAKGKDLGWTKDVVMSKLGREITDSEMRRRLEYNVTRIMRTSHQRAGNAATSLWAQRNNHIVSAMIRVAGGNPCLACVSLDGVEIPVGDTLSDHPNGGCSLSMKVKSLEEMGFAYKDLPPAARRRWTGIQVPYRNMRSKFYALPEAEQRKVFGNDKLFNLWKTEKFPLEQLAVNRGGMFVPATYQQIAAKLETLGGVSSPNVGIAYKTGLKAPDAVLTPADKQFISLIDPKDRANTRGAVIRGIDADQLGDMKTANGQNLMGYGDDAVSGVPPQLLDDAIAKLNGKAPIDADWYDFNEYARKLGLATRKASDGSTYWIVGKGKVDDVVKGIAPKKKIFIEIEDSRGIVPSNYAKVGDFSEDVSDSVQLYTTSRYREINTSLRHPETFDEMSSAFIQKKQTVTKFVMEPGMAKGEMRTFHLPYLDKRDNIKKAINESAITKDIKVFRGVQFNPNLKIGDIFEDKAFCSTSINFNEARTFTKVTHKGMRQDKLGNIMSHRVFEIHVPSGSRGLSIPHWTKKYEYPQMEREIILQAGTKFRKVGEEVRGRIYVDILEIVE